ncbi:MAG: sugar ABC transporter ATP-binding protein [Rhizobiaceae bacterium]
MAAVAANADTETDVMLAVDARNIEMHFGGTAALKGVTFSAEQGKIHALVGANGAGKSTFLGIIAGRISPTRGEMTILGDEYEFGSPRAAKAKGISAIYQELTIVPARSAMVNVYLGQMPTSMGLVNERAMLAGFKDLCRQFNVKIDPRVRAGRLSVADQQMLEIMRGVQSKARILLFDEPTASLAPPERQALFRIMRQLKAANTTLFLVSHNLEEVLEVADTITVFREGALVASEPTAKWNKPALVRAMIGHDVKDTPPRISRLKQANAIPLVSARNVTVAGAIEDIDLDVHAGEILGIGGLVGSGRSTLLRALAGLEPASTGELIVGGKSVPWPRNTREALRHGLALVPEDRKTQGLVLGRSSVDNVVMTNFRKVARIGVLNRAAMQRHTREVASEFGFSEKRINEKMRNLSGGNQQKMLLGKWSFHRPKVLLVDEPTRGIDIGAKEEIIATLRKMADAGLGIIVVSSELEEIVAMSDNVLVLSAGRTAAKLNGGQDEITVPAILRAAFKLAGESHGESEQHVHHRQ